MSTFGRSSSRKVTPPSASYMSNDQFGAFNNLAEDSDANVGDADEYIPVTFG